MLECTCYAYKITQEKTQEKSWISQEDAYESGEKCIGAAEEKRPPCANGLTPMEPMLAKKYKIPGRYRIERVFEKGKKISGHLFTLRYYARRHSLRFAVIMPAKLKVNAVVRNRIKRRLYELIRLSLYKTPAFLITQPYDILIVAHRPEIAEMPFETLQKELVYLMKRIK